MNSERRKISCCLLAFESKRAADFKRVSSLIGAFASRGYCFNKASVVAFDLSDEIVRAIKDGLLNYDNLVLYCPSAMEKALKEFVVKTCGGAFDGTGTLISGNLSVFVMISDGENFLSPLKISDELDKKYSVKYARAYIKTVGAAKTAIENAIESARSKCEGLSFNICDNFGDCTIEIVYSDETRKSAFDEAYRAMLTELNDYVYALENIPLAERLFELLKLRRMKIGVAESFTGGGVGKRLVDIPGISEVFDEGLNTYSNEAKMRRLGVREETLRAYGAVSEEVAAQMAEGLISGGGCNVAVATTGIAGPASDNTRKPVGLIYIAVGVGGKVSVYKYNLKGDRETITQTAINLALYLAFKTIK